MRDEFVLPTLGITATAIGRTGLAVTTSIRSQLRRLLNSVPRARIALVRVLDGAIRAIRIGFALLPTTPLTGRRRPLVTTGALLVAATGFAIAFVICICATGCARVLVLVGATGPVATVSTTPVAV